MMTAFFWLLALFMLLLTLSVRPMGAWLAPLLLLLHARYHLDTLAGWLPFMDAATFKGGFEGFMLAITLAACLLLLALGNQSWQQMQPQPAADAGAPSAADPVPLAG